MPVLLGTYRVLQFIMRFLHADDVLSISVEISLLGVIDICFIACDSEMR